MKKFLYVGVVLMCLECDKNTKESQISVERKTDSTTIPGSMTIDSYMIQPDVTDTIGGKEVGPVVCEIEPYIDPEIPPQFPGGVPALFKFIKENVHWPRMSPAINKIMFVGFTVQIDGSITDIQVLRGIDKLHDEEAIWVIKLMPKWKPGRMYDKLIPMSCTIPFRVEDDAKK